MEKIKVSDLFEIHGAYSSDEIKTDEVTMFIFTKKIINLMEKRGCSYAHLSVHKTNLTENPFSPSSPLYKIQHKENSYLFIEEIKESFFLTPTLQENGNILRGVHVPVYIKGPYLFLLVFSDDEDNFKNSASNTATRIVNAIRLTHGLHSAGPHLYRCFFDKKKDNFSINSGEFVVYISSNNPRDDLSAFANFGIKEVSKLPFNPDADILFNKALSETKPENRFLFLWLCFESMVPSDERRNLFEVRLSSEIINSEVLRLFNIRCELTHEGKSKISTVDCLSIIWAIRIAICPDSNVQKSLCNSYEEWIDASGFELPAASHSKKLEARFDKTHEIFKLINDLKQSTGSSNSDVLEVAVRELWTKTFC